MLRKPLSLLAFALVSISQCFAQVEAYITTDQFWNAQNGNYVDVNMAIDGASLVYQENPQGHEQAQVEVITIVQQDEQIVDFRKTLVNSPIRLDSSKGEMIHRERFPLPAGSYELVLEVKDMFNTESETSSMTKQMVVGNFSEKPQFSDVQLAERIRPAQEQNVDSKFGYEVVPYVSTYFPDQLDDLRFYAELYNTDKALGADADLLITYSIREFGSNSVAGSYKQLQRSKARDVLPIIAEFDISELPSGHFNLFLEVMDREGNIVASRKQYLERNNPVKMDLQSLTEINTLNTFVDRIDSRDTLYAYIDCLLPIADALERKMIEDRRLDLDDDLSKKFLYSFWANRNPQEPEQAWLSYFQAVKRANRLYGTRIKHGYQTDRGRVFLQYGAANTVTDRSNDMNAYPYQIWHYYKAGRFNDKRFIFYLPDLVTNDYVLIHSEIPGEIKEPRWNEVIHGRNNNTLNELRQQSMDHMSGNRADEYFEIPR